MNEAKAAIEALIRDSNRSWSTGDPDAVASLFHPDAVIASPSGQTIAHGRGPIVQSYVDYCSAAKTEAFAESDFQVHVVGDTAMASYTFDVTYVLDGDTHTERGREILTLVRAEGGWQAIWRMQLPLSGEA